MRFEDIFGFKTTVPEIGTNAHLFRTLYNL